MPENGPISGFTEMGATIPAAADELVVVDKSDTTDDPVNGTTKRWEWLDFLRELFATRFGADAGASDTYVVTLTPAPAAYVTGEHYRFKANTANTGACTVNFNSLGAKIIKKAAGGITTDLADNDIRAGQWVDLVYDGTNMQMQSLLGNTPSGGGTPGGADGDVQYRVDASTFGGGPLVREDANTVAQRNGATGQVFRVHGTYTSGSNFEAVRIEAATGGHKVQSEKGATGTLRSMAIGGSQIAFQTGVSSLSTAWDINSASDNAILPGGDGTQDIGSNTKKIRNIRSLANPTYVAATFTKTGDTTLANVTGLTRPIQNQKRYKFEAELFFDADAVGGHKYAIASSGAVSSIIYEILSIDNTTNANVITSRQTASGGSAGQAGATAGYTRIVGHIKANDDGNLTVQFAQNAATGASSILAGSTFQVELIEN